MTPRYRCPFCGSFNGTTAAKTRVHLLGTHRRALIQGLGLIETFGTHEEENPP